ncbi:MAG: hypothetical protein AAF390_08305 [Pseudomonadota bacterium]
MGHVLTTRPGDKTAKAGPPSRRAGATTDAMRTLQRMAAASPAVAGLSRLQDMADRRPGPDRRGGVVQRAYTGVAPAIIYDDWERSIGTGPLGIAYSLHRTVFEATNRSDAGLTLEDEIEAAGQVTADYLVDQKDTARLDIWQTQMSRAFGLFQVAYGAQDWTVAIGQLDDAVKFLLRIQSLDQAEPDFDVTWKTRVPADGSIATRRTGTRMEALFEVEIGGRPVKKNLNVSLRRHWWSGLTSQSVANPAGNSLMSPKLGAAEIARDIEAVAQQYKAHVAQKGAAGEFAATTPSGQVYWVNHLDRQQPHTFPARGPHTVSFTGPEYTAAVRVKLHHEGHVHNRQTGVSDVQVRQALAAAPKTLGKLGTLGIGFGKDYLKSVA